MLENNCTCPICGKKFHLKPYAVKRAKRHFCSKECFYKAKVNDMSGKNNHQYGLKGSKNSSWESDRKLTRYGYIRIRVLDHPFRDLDDTVFEHRLVAEKYLLTKENSVEVNGKLYLSPNYVVHHIDFNRQNNSVDNLAVMTKKEHTKLHSLLNPNKKDSKTGKFLKNDKTIVNFKKTTLTAKVPTKATDGSAGFDFYVDSSESIVIPAHKTVMFNSGIAMVIPKGYFGAIYSRSGLSTKMGIRPATCVAVIDSDYRGAIGLPLHNDTDEDKTIQPYERVAQLVVHKIPEIVLKEVKSLDEFYTERGENGFGSSGK